MENKKDDVQPPSKKTATLATAGALAALGLASGLAGLPHPARVANELPDAGAEAGSFAVSIGTWGPVATGTGAASVGATGTGHFDFTATAVGEVR
jgi:hypothetical protein